MSWRLFGNDPAGVAFNLYRAANGGAPTKLNGPPLTATTDYTDTPASLSTTSYSYFVRPVVNGTEQADSETAADYVVDRLSTLGENEQFLEAYQNDGTFLWRMAMGPNSVNQYAYEPGSSAISIDDTDNVTVHDIDGDGRAEVSPTHRPPLLDRTATRDPVTRWCGRRREILRERVSRRGKQFRRVMGLYSQRDSIKARLEIQKSECVISIGRETVGGRMKAHFP